MFGGTGFGQSTFGQPAQQQQQQPAQGGLFGGGGAFGAPATPAFGGSTFGAPQQPQQNTFGGGGAFGAQSGSTAFGTPATPAPAFGAPASTGLFGAASQPAATSTFSFGGGATSSPFGAPAATSTAPTGGLFGAKPATTTFGGGGAFGQPQQQAPATGGLFGGGAQAGAFGQPAQQPGTGTAIAEYAATTIMEPAPEEGKPPPANQTPHHFQSISCMPAYKGYSVEELRFQDYQANRKVPTAQPASAFGNSFGQTSAPAFGAPTAAPSMFGSTTPAFGAAQPATSAFGQPKPAGGGLFGATSTPAFGQSNTGGGLFGQPATSAPAASGGLFGSSTFGQQPQTSAAPAFGSAFGAAPKPATSGFSFGGATTPAPATGGLFGQPQQQAASNPFGQSSAAPATGGLFGQAAQPAQTNSTFSFGSASAAPKPGGLFGAAPAANNTFGQANAAKPAPFSFGQAAPAPATGGLFGQSQPTQQSGFGAPAPAGGSLFGGGGTSSLFGQPNNAAPAASGFGGGSLFGKPAAPAGGGSLFGQPAQANTGSLFGQPQQQPQQQGSLFGSSFGGGLSTSQQPQQQTAYANADDVNAYGSNPLFASSSSAPTVEIKKKQPSIFTAFRGSPVNRSSTKITRLRGFGNSTASPSSSLSFSSSLNGSSNGPATPGGASSPRGSPLRLVNGIGDDTALSPSAFVSRPSVKKLVIDRKAITDTSHMLGRSRLSSPGESPGAPPRSAEASRTSKVTFNPEVEIPSRSAARSLPQTSTPFRRDESSQSLATEAATPVKKSGGSNTNLGEPSSPESAPEPSAPTSSTSAPAASSRAAQPLKSGEYYSKPSLDALQKLPASALESVANLIVGRVGFGEVRFNEPVDLSTLPSLEALYEIVSFSERNLAIDGSGEGRGLDRPATVTLLKCWPVDRSTRKPIKEGPKIAQHERRLQAVEGTAFISFSPAEGEWVFDVQGFST